MCILRVLYYKYTKDKLSYLLGALSLFLYGLARGVGLCPFEANIQIRLADRVLFNLLPPKHNSPLGEKGFD